MKISIINICNLQYKTKLAEICYSAAGPAGTGGVHLHCLLLCANNHDTEAGRSGRWPPRHRPPIKRTESITKVNCKPVVSVRWCKPSTAASLQDAFCRRRTGTMAAIGAWQAAAVSIAALTRNTSSGAPLSPEARALLAPWRRPWRGSSSSIRAAAPPHKPMKGRPSAGRT
jgi:hypothetical protein